MSSSTASRSRARTPGARPTATRPPAPGHRPPAIPPPAVAAPHPPVDDDRLLALETEVEQLRTAMASRAVIEQAKGVLMLLAGCGEQAAFALLTHISSHTHRKVREIATEITTSAAGRRPLPADIRAIIRDACPPPSSPR
jgi:ANTAR domain